MLPMNGAEQGRHTASAEAGMRALAHADTAGRFVLPRILRRPARQLRRTGEQMASMSARNYGAIALALGVLGGAGTLVSNETASGKAGSLVASASAAAGFRIAAVEVSGNREMSKIDVIANIDLGEARSLFSFDVHGARDSLKNLPWVHDVTVTKSYPDRILVDIVEREPIAVWQDNEELWLIDRSGEVIAGFDERFAQLPLVVGRGANVHAAEMLATTGRHPLLASRVGAYVRVGDRRWNVRIKDGPTVLLPQNDLPRALVRLAALDDEKSVLERDITHLDMRIAGRMTVGLGEFAERLQAERVEARTNATVDAEPRI